MCIVVDINTLAPVFSEHSKQHKIFSPIKEWIEKGQGFLVFGGSRYMDELMAATKYLRIIRLLNDSGKAIRIRKELVDKAEVEIIKRTKDTDCDDQHIIALLRTSRCPLLCSNDSRSFKHIKNRALYPQDMKRVRIYTSKTRPNTLLKPMKRDSLKNQA